MNTPPGKKDAGEGLTVPESVDLAHRIYDILLDCAGADEGGRLQFVYWFVNKEDKFPGEYRFQGALGFGGKFWAERFKVTCYSEDETKQRLEMIERTNEALRKIHAPK